MFNSLQVVDVKKSSVRLANEYGKLAASNNEHVCGPLVTETIKANIYFYLAGFNIENFIQATSLTEGKVVQFADVTKTEETGLMCFPFLLPDVQEPKVEQLKSKLRRLQQGSVSWTLT